MSESYSGSKLCDRTILYWKLRWNSFIFIQLSANSFDNLNPLKANSVPKVLAICKTYGFYVVKDGVGVSHKIFEGRWTLGENVHYF